MSIKLDWEIDKDEAQPPELKERQLPFSSIFAIAAFLVLALIAFGVWQVSQKEADKAEEDLRQQVQAVIDQERQALLDQDGELFLSYHQFEPADFPALLRPDNMAILRSGPTVSRVEQHGNDIYANIEWTAENQSWQRITFFQWQNGRIVHIPNSPVYWGQVIHSHHEWGDLFVHEQDQEWTDAIAGFIGAEVEQFCRVQKSPRCGSELDNHLSVTIASGYDPGAAPDQIRVPSPRRLALDGSGQPGEPFWEQLRMAITDTLAPVTVQFAALEEYAPLYKVIARDFSAENPGITIEIIPIDLAIEDPLAWAIANDVDGAAVTPDERALAAGWVYDLTDFIETDSGFDQADFYEQIWRGAWWQERMWFMPENASMQLLYYDKISYREAGLPEPSLRWTWDEMGQDLSVLRIPEPRPVGTSWGFLDVTRDALYAYAYNWENGCSGETAVQCHQPLQDNQITAALSWYKEMIGRPEMMPDLTILPPSERQRMMFNWRAVVWVDTPVHYEFRLLIDPLGVVPFPGSDRFDGITPLTVNGSFISSASDSPRATWQWLKYLSYQNLNRQQRLIPARPSIAAKNAFWIILPQALSNAMRTAFPFSRAITVDEQNLINWEQLTAVASGELTPQEAANIQPRTPWFTTP